MHCLEIIKKINNENPDKANQTGKLKFNKKAGCLVYNPPGVNNFKKENKSKSRKRC